MSKTAAAEFIASLDPLAYPDRMRLVAREARRLADSSGLDAVPGAGQIAVRLLGTAGPALAWPESYRYVVSALRRHGDPDTVEAALELDTAESWT